MEASATRLAYLAGFIDGEGCITVVRYRRDRPNRVHRGWYQPFLIVCNRDPAPLLVLRETFGGCVVCQKSHHGWGEVYRYQLRRRDALEEVLRALMPYLIVKREVAGLVLDFLAAWPRRGPGCTGYTVEQAACLDGLCEAIRARIARYSLHARAREE